MIVVKLELWPRGSERDAKEIGRMYIANDGTRGPSRGDYQVAVCRKGSTKVPREMFALEYDLPKAARTGHVLNYPRLSYNVWRLITRALKSAFPEEK